MLKSIKKWLAIAKPIPVQKLVPEPLPTQGNDAYTHAKALLPDLQFLFEQAAKMCNVEVNVVLYCDMVFNEGNLTRKSMKAAKAQELALVNTVSGLSDNDLEQYSKQIQAFELIVQTIQALSANNVADFFTVLNGCIVIIRPGMKTAKESFVELVNFLND